MWPGSVSERRSGVAWQCFREAGGMVRRGSVSERPAEWCGLAVFQGGRVVWPGSISGRPRGVAWQCFREAEWCGLAWPTEVIVCCWFLAVFQGSRVVCARRRSLQKWH